MGLKAFTFSCFLLLSAVSVQAQDALPRQITEAFDAYVALPQSLVPVLKSASDKQSADAAAVRLLPELKKLYGIRDALRKVNALTPQQNEVIRRKYERDMREQWGLVYTEMFRLQQNRCYGSNDFAKLYKLMCLLLNK